jgi:hypothetical protein
MATQATSWTGSERQRREQGGCAKAPRGMNADLTADVYRVAPGTVVGYKMSGDEEWIPYITKKQLAVRGLEDQDERYLYLKFQGYRIRVLRTSTTILSPSGKVLAAARLTDPIDV